MSGVLGLDPSLTSFGWAHSDGRIGTIVPPAVKRVLIDGTKKPDRWAEVKRLELLRHRFRELLGATRPEVVVLEGYSLGSPQGAHQLGELGGIVRVELCERRIPWAEVSPHQRQQFATGKGNARKDDVHGAAVRAGSPARNDDEADAWWLMCMGLWRYDRSRAWQLDATPVRDAAIAKVRWPEGTLATVAGVTNGGQA